MSSTPRPGASDSSAQNAAGREYSLPSGSAPHVARSSQPAFLIRFRPPGPWRPGPESGAPDRVDRVYHSDTLFSAISGAMSWLGLLQEWLDATAHSAGVSEVRFSSCFPYQGQTLFVVPPRSLWPPPPSARVRWKSARFVPLSAVETLVADKPMEEDRWRVDGLSECLLPTGKNSPASGPVRVAVRSSAAVDRLGNGVAVHSTACLEFSPDSGMWTVVVFSGDDAKDKWGDPLKAALRLLADSGFGGKRSRGWGRAEPPEIAEGLLPDLLMKTGVPIGEVPTEAAYWLLSLFSPAEQDKIDWQRGNYSVVTRSGRAESSLGWGAIKKVTRMVEEGSVLLASQPLFGAARDVAPDGFSHPVFRAGFAVAIPIPWRAPSRAASLRPVTVEAPPAAVRLSPTAPEPAPAAEPETEPAQEVEPILATELPPEAVTPDEAAESTSEPIEVEPAAESATGPAAVPETEDKPRGSPEGDVE